MSQAPSPLETLLARVLGEISSQTLKLDPASHPRLVELAGTTIRFDIVPPALPRSSGSPEPRSVTLLVRADGLDLQAGNAGNAHAVVSGSLPDILNSFFNPDRPGSVRIDGDEAALQALARLFRDLEPDLAGPLAGVLGREMADGLVGLAEAGIAFLKSAAETAGTGARREAGKAWVDDPSFAELMDRLDALRLRVDRLDARVRLASESAGPGQ